MEQEVSRKKQDTFLRGTAFPTFTDDATRYINQTINKAVDDLKGASDEFEQKRILGKLMSKVHFSSGYDMIEKLKQAGFREHEYQADVEYQAMQLFQPQNLVYSDVYGSKAGPMPYQYSFDNRILPMVAGNNAIDPKFYSQPQSLNQVQETQISHIVEKMDDLLGQGEQSNFFRLREMALESKWDLIIGSLNSINKTSEKSSFKQVWGGPDATLIGSNGYIQQSPFTRLRQDSYDIFDHYWFQEIYGPQTSSLGGWPASVYLSSEKNIDMGQPKAGVDLWMVLNLDGTGNTIPYRTALNALLKQNGVFGFRTEEFGLGSSIKGPNKKALTMAQRMEAQGDWNASKVEASPEGPLSILIKLAGWRKNSNSWKYEFKPRTGVHDKIYKTIVPNVSFKGYNVSLNSAEVNANVALNQNDALNGQFISFLSCRVLLGCQDIFSGGLKQGDSGITVSVNYYPNYADWIKLMIKNHNLNRAYWAKKSSLQENAKNRLKRYLNRDKKMVRKLTNFLGAEQGKSKGSFRK